MIVLSSAICIGALAAVAVTAPAMLILATGLVLFAAVAFPVWLLRSTYYRFDEDHLHIRSGPFRWNVPFQQIQGVEPTRNPLSSPALSLDRLRIDYGRGRSIMVSPQDKRRFLNRLEQARGPGPGTGIHEDA
ncbi:MAG: PH domain-containing protein [Candidatus Competibacterales bacterium]|nr:PH domain-containing protein [Candidatus Competibacterales bacterium]